MWQFVLFIGPHASLPALQCCVVQSDTILKLVPSESNENKHSSSVHTGTECTKNNTTLFYIDSVVWGPTKETRQKMCALDLPLCLQVSQSLFAHTCMLKLYALYFNALLYAVMWLYFCLGGLFELGGTRAALLNWVCLPFLCFLVYFSLKVSQRHVALFPILLTLSAPTKYFVLTCLSHDYIIYYK